MAMLPDARGLRYVYSDEPGYRRRRAGQGFVYLDERGKRITGEQRLDRIRSLAIPPAWTDVWICADADGHLQATGRDARGRKQYRYHPDWRASQERTKFERLVPFGSALPELRRRIAADMRAPDLSRPRVLATVVHLLEVTLIRVGNEEYARNNGSLGLTTMRVRNVELEAGALRFHFPGKSGRSHEIEVHDPRAARVVRRCQELPGQRLFQYLDDDGVAHAIGSADVNEYLRETTGGDFTAKDIRTWAGTLFAGVALADLEPPASQRAAAREVAAATDAVAGYLGNTRAIARASYVHPDVVELYEHGALGGLWSEKPARNSRWFFADERRLLHTLRRARRRLAGRSSGAREVDAAA